VSWTPLCVNDKLTVGQRSVLLHGYAGYREVFTLGTERTCLHALHGEYSFCLNLVYKLTDTLSPRFGDT
jgi:hypothetical protein